ncbi:hypothetical protein J2T16_004286 [Paenibacillus intestini]|nr:hypothetical protein [Paenibacillus intestini]
MEIILQKKRKDHSKTHKKRSLLSIKGDQLRFILLITDIDIGLSMSHLTAIYSPVLLC